MSKRSAKDLFKSNVKDKSFEDLENFTETDLRDLGLHVTLDEWQKLLADKKKEKNDRFIQLVVEAAFTRREHPDISTKQLADEIYRALKSKGH